MPKIQRFIPVRRFEMGASAMGADNMLKEYGYSVYYTGKKLFRVWRDGKKVESMTQKQLIALLDEVRVARGLEPIMACHAKTNGSTSHK